jgi:hypothetical protein
MMKLINLIIKKLSSTELFCYLIIYFSLILIIGTISQKNMGLLYAQKTYFTSYIILINKTIPIPGGLVIIYTIFLNLFFKLYNDKFKNDIGTMIIHIGSFLLIISGLLANTYNFEGNLLLH